MSLVTVTSSASSLSPKVWVEDDRLIAETSTLSQVLLLGASKRRVEVDPYRNTLTLQTRSFWLLRRSVTLSLHDISHFEYRYGSMATSWDFLGNVHDSLESYSVSASLHRGEELYLISFRGAGSAQTGVLGVLMGDSAVDFQGDQGSRSLGFIDALQAFTGIGLSKRARPKRLIGG
jgi:hypothetical protein